MINLIWDFDFSIKILALNDKKKSYIFLETTLAWAIPISLALAGAMPSSFACIQIDSNFFF